MKFEVAKVDSEYLLDNVRLWEQWLGIKLGKKVAIVIYEAKEETNEEVPQTASQR